MVLTKTAVLKSHMMWDTNVSIYALNNKLNIHPYWKNAQASNYEVGFTETTENEIKNCKSDDVDEKMKTKILTELLPRFRKFRYVDCSLREKHLTEISVYVRKKYGLKVPSTGRRMNKINGNDAKILLSALDNDFSMVTHNLKDFLVCLALGMTLIDPVTNQMLLLDDSVWNTMQKDSELQCMISQLYESEDQVSF